MITTSTGASGRLAQAKLATALVGYCFARFPSLSAALFLSLLSTVAELAAIGSLFPLAELAAGRIIEADSQWGVIAGIVAGPPSVAVFLALFATLLLIRLVTAFLSNLVVAYVSRQLIAHFSSTAFAQFMEQLSFEEIQRRSIGYFMNLAGDEANRASQVVASFLRFVPVAALALMYFAALMYKSLWLGLVVAGFLSIAGLSLIGAFRKTHRLSGRQQQESRALNSYFMDSMNSLRTVRAYTAEAFVAGRYRKMIYGYARTCFLVDALNLLSRFGPGVVVVLAGWLLVLSAGETSRLIAHFPFIMVTLVLLLRFFPVVGQAVDTFMRMVADLRVGQDLTSLLSNVAHYAESRVETDETQIAQVSEIRFENVSFWYESGRAVLRDFSAIFEKGRSYVLVGASGVGKSTLVDLLVNFYRPSRGRILVNGLDAAHLSIQSLRQRILLVEQSPRILNDTVMSNVTLGRSFTEAEVRDACRGACIEDEIDRLPEGFATVLSYQGANLSGGQRQRLAIARALVRQPDVLLLDESTSALDETTRAAVIGNLLAWSRQRLLICITHDQGLARQFDVVLALQRLEAAADKGKAENEIST
jgi:ABC-type bacteriocin/lantibiotic exporter with double-glycine peptidase domain